MSLKSHFEKLGAPLKNVRRSWGAVRPADGAVFLRVWQDLVVRRDDRNFVEAGFDRDYSDEELGPGGLERKKHLELIRQGSPCFLVMCRASDPEEKPRQTKGFNARELFVGGRVVEDHGSFLIELRDRVPVETVGNR